MNERKDVKKDDLERELAALEKKESSLMKEFIAIDPNDNHAHWWRIGLRADIKQVQNKIRFVEDHLAELNKPPFFVWLFGMIRRV